MLTRKLALGLVVTIAASLAGCKCCNPCQNCASPAIIRSGAPPCNNCGPTGGPGVIVAPPPGGAVGPAPGGSPYVPPPGPYGASYERKV